MREMKHHEDMDETPGSPLTEADAFARALAGKGVDPNEGATCFVHLRVLLNGAGDDPAARERAAQAWWTWLDMLTNRSAQAVLRSGRTRFYYQAIQDAARAYLDGLSAQELEQALGWGVRLMRYYREDQAALEAPPPFGDIPSMAPGQQWEEPVPNRPALPPEPTIPEVGAVFTAPVIDADDTAVLIEIVGFDWETEVLALIREEHLTGKSYVPGNPARVLVLKVWQQKSGRTIVEVRPATLEEADVYRKEQSGHEP